MANYVLFLVSPESQHPILVQGQSGAVHVMGCTSSRYRNRLDELWDEYDVQRSEEDPAELITAFTQDLFDGQWFRVAQGLLDDALDLSLHSAKDGEENASLADQMANPSPPPPNQEGSVWVAREMLTRVWLDELRLDEPALGQPANTNGEQAKRIGWFIPSSLRAAPIAVEVEEQRCADPVDALLSQFGGVQPGSDPCLQELVGYAFQGPQDGEPEHAHQAKNSAWSDWIGGSEGRLVLLRELSGHPPLLSLLTAPSADSAPSERAASLLPEVLRPVPLLGTCQSAFVALAALHRQGRVHGLLHPGLLLLQRHTQAIMLGMPELSLLSPAHDPAQPHPYPFPDAPLAAAGPNRKHPTENLVSRSHAQLVALTHRVRTQHKHRLAGLLLWPPESLEGRYSSAAGDVWMLAACLVAMLCRAHGQDMPSLAEGALARVDQAGDEARTGLVKGCLQSLEAGAADGKYSSNSSSSDSSEASYASPVVPDNAVKALASCLHPLPSQRPTADKAAHALGVARQQVMGLRGAGESNLKALLKKMNRKPAEPEPLRSRAKYAQHEVLLKLLVLVPPSQRDQSLLLLQHCCEDPKVLVSVDFALLSEPSSSSDANSKDQDASSKPEKSNEEQAASAPEQQRSKSLSELDSERSGATHRMALKLRHKNRPAQLDVHSTRDQLQQQVQVLAKKFKAPELRLLAVTHTNPDGAVLLLLQGAVLLHHRLHRAHTLGKLSSLGPFLVEQLSPPEEEAFLCYEVGMYLHQKEKQGFEQLAPPDNQGNAHLAALIKPGRGASGSIPHAPPLAPAPPPAPPLPPPPPPLPSSSSSSSSSPPPSRSESAASLIEEPAASPSISSSNQHLAAPSASGASGSPSPGQSWSPSPNPSPTPALPSRITHALLVRILKKWSRVLNEKQLSLAMLDIRYESFKNVPESAALAAPDLPTGFPMRPTTTIFTKMVGAETDAHAFDLTQLRHMFTRQQRRGSERNSGRRSRQAAAVAEISALDPQRSQTIIIGMRRMFPACSADELATALCTLEPEVCDKPEALEVLRDMMPRQGEVQAIQLMLSRYPAGSQRAPLNQADMFLLTLSKQVKRPNQRVDCLLFQRKFAGNAARAEQAIQICTQAWSFLSTDEELRRMLGTVVQAGTKLHKAGRHYESLSSVLNLASTKQPGSAQNRVTLLQFLVMEVEGRKPGAVRELVSRFKPVQQATTVSLAELSKELNEWTNQLALAKTELKLLTEPPPAAAAANSDKEKGKENEAVAAGPAGPATAEQTGQDRQGSERASPLYGRSEPPYPYSPPRADQAGEDNNPAHNGPVQPAGAAGEQGGEVKTGQEAAQATADKQQAPLSGAAKSPTDQAKEKDPFTALLSSFLPAAEASEAHTRQALNDLETKMRKLADLYGETADADEMFIIFYAFSQQLEQALSVVHETQQRKQNEEREKSTRRAGKRLKKRRYRTAPNALTPPEAPRSTVDNIIKAVASSSTVQKENGTEPAPAAPLTFGTRNSHCFTHHISRFWPFISPPHTAAHLSKHWHSILYSSNHSRLQDDIPATLVELFARIGPHSLSVIDQSLKS
eukprot:g75996.t1